MESVTLTPLHCLVPLSRGYKAVVSPEDFPKAMRVKWHVLIRKDRPCTPYASGWIRTGGRKSHIYLHRYLMDAPPSLMVDHKNGDGLDCTSSNMRLATQFQNEQNKGPRQKATSRFKGVRLHKKVPKWYAGITVDGQRRYLGMFATEEEAARAYDAAAREMHGEFARVNFPERANRVPEPKGNKS